MSFRNGEHLPWNAFYAFPEFEFAHQDFEVLNWFTSKSPDSFLTFTVLVVKFLRRHLVNNAKDGGKQKNEKLKQIGRIGEAEIYGKVMLINGDVKRNLGGKTELVKMCKTEAERIEALREYFGL